MVITTWLVWTRESRLRAGRHLAHEQKKSACAAEIEGAERGVGSVYGGVKGATGIRFSAQIAHIQIGRRRV